MAEDCIAGLLEAALADDEDTGTQMGQRALPSARSLQDASHSAGGNDGVRQKSSRRRSRSRDRRRKGSRSRSRDRRRKDSRRRKSKSRDRKKKSDSRDRSREARKKSRSESPPRRKVRKSLWDAAPDAGGMMGAGGIQGSGGIFGIGVPAPPGGSKKAREIFVGNLLQGQVNDPILRQFFKELFSKVPAYASKYPHLLDAGPIVEVQMSSDGKFAFCEFATEELAMTALEFDRIELFGRPIKCGRSNNYVPSGQTPMPLDVGHLRQMGFIHTMPRDLTVATTGETKKQRELFVGQLPLGINAQQIRELFEQACMHLPDFRSDLGAPVLNVDLHTSGTYAFVEFQSHGLATSAKGLFHNMEVMGKRLTVDRPTGYVPPGQVGLPGLPMGLGMPGLPQISAGLPANFRQGDWICAACNNHNFASKDICFKCTAGKTAGLLPAQ
mmetsp:Transcript_32679/g.84713  ORF Transcript_32679/g.84713 Transcript_32679/m.84713 type:complete len:441 (+) Transcript_32679:31-1353(+)